MSRGEGQWARGEGWRVGVVLAAALVLPMLLRAIGLPPGFSFIALGLLPLLSGRIGRSGRDDADPSPESSSGDPTATPDGADGRGRSLPTPGEALAPFRRGLSRVQLFGTGGFSPGVFGQAGAVGPGQIEAVYGKVTGRHRADLPPGLCLARLASVLDRDELYRLESLDEQGMSATRRATLEVPDYPLEITVRPALDDDGVDLERADVVIVSDPPTSIAAQELDAMRVIGQLFTILDVPAGPPKAEGDDQAADGGAGSDG